MILTDFMPQALLASVSGNLGIGTTTPNELLTVAGNILATGNIQAANCTVTNNLSVQGNITYLDTNVSVTSAMYIDANTSETALRITQIGSGDVIRVEDSTNPDITPFVVKADGKVGIGTETPNERLTVAGNISATGLYLNKDRYNLVSNHFGASADSFYLVNTFSNVVTATLPSTPLTGTTIQFADPYATWNSNLFIVNRSGNNIEGVADDLYCNVANARFTLTFVGSSIGWNIYQ